MATIDMQTMRYINLLDRASRVKTRKCFVYNNAIIFAVPEGMISQAVGPNAIHIREIQEKLGKKVRIIKEREGLENAGAFIEEIVAPVKFRSIEKTPEGLVLTAGSPQTKATLLGRNKRRFEELKQIIEDNFGVTLKIV